MVSPRTVPILEGFLLALHVASRTANASDREEDRATLARSGDQRALLREAKPFPPILFQHI